MYRLSRPANGVPGICSLSGREIDLAQMDTNFVAVESRFFQRVFFVFASLAVLSLLISLLGREIGSRLSMGGHTDDSQAHEIIIGNDVLAVAANSIRYPEQRRDGVASRLDLYAIWPGMQGFTEENRLAFNNADPSKPLIFLSFEPRSLSRDMSGRLEPIYNQMLKGPGEILANGLMRYKLPEDAGYVDESVLVGIGADGEKFVARCIVPAAEQATMAGCDRDIHIGEDLTIMVRFPSSLLDDWKALDLALSAFAAQTVRTVTP
jgi:hypothetical protein